MKSEEKGKCYCPNKKPCPLNLSRVNHVSEVVKALRYEEECAHKEKQGLKLIKTKLKPVTKKYKCSRECRRYQSGTYDPMEPPMAVRRMFISHCEPGTSRAEDERARLLREKLKFDDECDESCRYLRCSRRYKKDGKKVTIAEAMPCDVVLPKPQSVVRHSTSDNAIFTVPSPKTSGEVIRAEYASIKPQEVVPPLPPNAAYKLFRPHSGIIVNQEPGYVSDVKTAYTGPGTVTKERCTCPAFCPKHQSNNKDRTCPRCHKLNCKKKTCRNNKDRTCPRCHKLNCKKKTCRKHALLLRLKKEKLKKQAKRKAKKRGICGSIPYVSAVTDGKPRVKRLKKIRYGGDEPCGLDEIPRPEHARIPPFLKRGTLRTHSLTVLPCTKEIRADIPYGILTGAFNMYDPRFGGRSRGKQGLTVSVMAYCLAFHYHPKQWTTRLIDNLVEAGDKWYLQCLDKVHDHSSVQGICEVIPYGKKQVLALNGKRMQVLLGEPEIVGYTMSRDPTVYNLCRGLKAFFAIHRAGVLLSKVLKVSIWKDKVCYYIFDPSGRDSKAYSNFSNGSAALINVKDLKAVAQIILARSILEDQRFVLASVKVLKMVKETADDDLEDEKELTQAEKDSMGYRILNENSAIVNANMHIGDRCFENAQFRQALPTAVVVLTYAKISPPNTWHAKTLDKILRFGNKLYADCADPKVLIDLTIDNIPNVINIGLYCCEIIIYRERTRGQLFAPEGCYFNIKSGLEDFFSREYNAGIIDFISYAIAVWRQKDMYYMFDPYPRTKDGLRNLGKGGRACCMMLLNTEAIGDVFAKTWGYLPAKTQFYIHAFKVLKLKKQDVQEQIYCLLNEEVDEDEAKIGKKKKSKKQILEMSKARGDGRVIHDLFTVETMEIGKEDKKIDEEHMGDIISLVDSIQEDFAPPIQAKYKNLPEEPFEVRVANLDSPTVSVTQIIPPWPKPRDKTNEPPEPDPSPEPTPPPTPPELPPPEGGVEEEEEKAEEEEDEEAAAARKEEEAKKKAEEEEARRKAEELPPPMPPPPPSPQPEVELEPLPMEEELDIKPPDQIERRILLTADARYRSKLRKLRRKITTPLDECLLEVTPSEELAKPNNFKALPDSSQIIRGSTGITDPKATDILPFASVMAIVTSYKYTINTWTPDLVNFVVDTARKLYENKKANFQNSAVHIIPKIAIGHQAYHASIEVVDEGPTWQLENHLDKKFFPKFDRGMLTTATYSCALFKKNGLYYIYDGSPCTAMGLRDPDKKGKACFLRFKSLHDLVCRIIYNKDGRTEDQQFILSRIIVRKLLTEPRRTLPDDYNFETRSAKSQKSKSTIVPPATQISSSLDFEEPKVPIPVGYRLLKSEYRIIGTTALNDAVTASKDIKKCHFISLIAMLMAAMHPIRTWNSVMIDTCIEKGIEIFEKATNLYPCEKRVIKNVLLESKYMNISIRKIIVVNENEEKRLEQYLKAVLRRLRYVIIKFPTASLVVCQADGYFHLFDPYPTPPAERTSKSLEDKRDSEQPKSVKSSTSTLSTSKQQVKEPKSVKSSTSTLSTSKQQVKVDKSLPDTTSLAVASWTLYRNVEDLIVRLKQNGGYNGPEFYTFELTSIRSTPKHAAVNYKLSPLFKPDVNPNMCYLKRRQIRPIVDEKMYWLDIDAVPWSRMNQFNDLGFERRTARTTWRDWDIEFPGDLYSLWGSVHPRDKKFAETNRGKQYLTTCAVAVMMAHTCGLSAWTGSFLDGIVDAGDRFFTTVYKKIGGRKNHEIDIDDLDTKFDEMYPFTFTIKYEKAIFGFVYNMLPDRFNLSKALTYFFEKYNHGILVCPVKNLAFGRSGISYYMYDCQSFGAPLFCPGKGASYALKCESLNRLIYCMAITLKIKSHGQQFHLYSLTVSFVEKSK